MDERPFCFAKLEIVFPKGEDGLRHTPESCMFCACKTECLRSAMATKDGLDVEQERVDRAFQSKTITFFQRWSAKKRIAEKKKQMRRQSENN